jgi:5-methylthioadenosine/S-adenosylhomocysteine deaminase
MTLMQFPTAWAATDEQYLKKTEDAILEFQNNPLVNIWLAPHAPYTGVYRRQYESLPGKPK